jgi:hypothetical protein
MRESGRFSPKSGPARRHIPVPLAGSRSRREPRYARPHPPSAAMLGGGYGSQRQRRQLKMCSPDEAQRNPGSIPGFRFTPSGLRYFSQKPGPACGTSLCRMRVHTPCVNRANARPDPASAAMLGGGHGPLLQKPWSISDYSVPSNFLHHCIFPTR